MVEKPVVPPEGVTVNRLPKEPVVQVSRDVDSTVNKRGPKHRVLIGANVAFRSTVEDEAIGVENFLRQRPDVAMLVSSG
jgi:hypothetical protein